jgi:hypothetical protein
VDVAFCCFGKLCRAENFDAIVGLLPQTRRREIHEALAAMSTWSRAEVVERLKDLRQTDAAEAIQRSGVDGLVWESLPRPLQRWMCARGRESNGRKDHQS